MFELGFILGTCVLALGAATILGLPILSRSARARVATTSPHLLVAHRNYFRVHNRTLFALVLLISLAILVGFGMLRAPHDTDPASPFALAGWLIAGLSLGALSSSIGMGMTAHSIARSTIATASHLTTPARTAPNKPTNPNIVKDCSQWIGAACMAASGITLMCAATLTVLYIATTEGWADDSAIDFQSTAFLLPSFALGTALSSIVAHSFGGMHIAALSTPQPPHSSPPPIGHLTIPVTRVADAISSITIIVIGSTVICINTQTAAPSLPFAPILFSILGLFATATAISVIRSDSSDSSTSALDRGLWVNIFLQAAIITGLSLWLFGNAGWQLTIAGFVGIAGAIVLIWIDRSLARISGQTPRPPWLARSIERACWLSIAVGAVALCGFFLGQSFDPEGPGTIGIAFAALGLIAPAPYLIVIAAIDALTPVRQTTAAVSGTISDAGSARPGESAAQTIAVSSDPHESTRLRDSGLRAYSSACAAIACWVACGAFVQHTASGPASQPASESTSWQAPDVAITLGAVLIAVAFVIALVGTGMRVIATTVKSAAAASNVEPEASRPTAFVNAILEGSARHGQPAVLFTTIAPGVLWCVLYWASEGPMLVISTFAVVFVASIIGLMLSLSASSAERASVPGPVCCCANPRDCSASAIPPSPIDGGQFDNGVDDARNCANNAAVFGFCEGDALGMSLQFFVGPCVHASTKLLAAAALALAVYFT
ncbi:MAG: hypothetical protein FWD57_09280 [Polyangiaceae bacterium]|nr:hypothetical protein [Polyangiaceae bacterium]